MKKGKLYGVSVGPGDSELLTLKAVKVINGCSVIATPITPQGNTMALDIVKGAVDLSNKKIIYAQFAMTKSAKANDKSHNESANEMNSSIMVMMWLCFPLEIFLFIPHLAIL